MAEVEGGAAAPPPALEYDCLLSGLDQLKDKWIAALKKIHAQRIECVTPRHELAPMRIGVFEWYEIPNWYYPGIKIMT